MDYEIEYQNLFGKVQDKVVEILSQDELIAKWGVQILPENLKDIDFQIKNAMSRQGVVVIVTTMKGTYGGHNSMTESWLIDNLEILVVENPMINRARLKKEELEYGTATDISYRIFETLGGPQGGHFGLFCPKTFEVGEDGGLVVSKCRFSCQFNNEIDGVIEKETKVKIPFVTHIEIDGLIAEIESLKSLVEGFDTEAIKQDVNGLKIETSNINSRIDDLDDVYQPIGDYSLRSEIPTKTSQLENNSGYLTSVSWNDITDRPSVALKSELPTSISQLVNDSGYITGVSWEDVSGKPMVALTSDIPTRTSQLTNDSGFLSIVTWDSIIGKPNLALRTDIPSLTSQLTNDSGYLTTVKWNDISNIPELVTPEVLSSTLRGYPTYDETNHIVDDKISRIHIDSEPTKLWTESKNQYVKGSLDIWKRVAVPGHWTDWEYSDGIEHQIELISEEDPYGIVGWLYKILDEEGWTGEVFDSEEAALSADQILWFGRKGSLYANREWIEPTEEWQHIDDVAKVSQIPTMASQLINDAYVDYSELQRQLNNYATIDMIFGVKEEIPTRTSQLVNDAGFLTTFPSLDPYATKEYVNGKIEEESASREELSRTLHEELEEKADISSVPTLTSQLENDAGFLTTVSWNDIVDRPDIEGLATTEYVDMGLMNLDTSIDSKIERKSPTIRRWTI